ncbi:MAG TPA: hypothetical protein ENI87_11425, partial [bacterium]|nr:hypothetical protein [bacterium]
FGVFQHRDHVLDRWGRLRPGEETFRDCRGCHRFDAEHLVSSPREHCEKCHFGTGALAFSADSPQRLDGFASRTRPAFRHHTHGMLECRQCHDSDGARRTPTNITLRTGPGQCARCHEKAQARAIVGELRWFRPACEDTEAGNAIARACGLERAFTIPTAEQLDAYAARLDRVFVGEREGEGVNALLQPGGGFSHGDHGAVECATCHQGTERSGAGVIAVGQDAAQACGECHQADGGRAAEFAPVAKVRRESFALGAFAHSDHYPEARQPGVCTEQAYERIAEQGCGHCHVYRPERAGFAGRDFPFAAGSSKHRYVDCRECHDVPGWTTGEALGGPDHAPLHGSTVAAAGGGGGWGTDGVGCTNCHVFGAADMARTRPEVEVRRWTARTFVFRGQTHPFISTVGGADEVQRDCRRCHRAVVPALPSRLIEKRFRHATHLPKVAAGETLPASACTTCHATAATSGSSPELAVDGRTYDLGACRTCHLGGDVREQVAADEGPVARRVVAFPHGPHVAKASCATCHEPGDEDVATRAEALDCSACHDHVADTAADDPRTEHLFGEHVESCRRCHGDVEDPSVRVPAIRGSEAPGDPRRGYEAPGFAGFTTAQVHPFGSRCSTCHQANVVDDRVQAILAAEQDFTQVRRLGKFHDGEGLSKQDLLAKFGNDRQKCITCHWRDNGRLRSGWGFDPESREVRTRFGSTEPGTNNNLTGK